MISLKQLLIPFITQIPNLIFYSEKNSSTKYQFQEWIVLECLHRLFHILRMYNVICIQRQYKFSLSQFYTFISRRRQSSVFLEYIFNS